MNDKQDLIYTQKTLIHAFFDGFTNGIIDANKLNHNEQQTQIKAFLMFTIKFRSTTPW